MDPLKTTLMSPGVPPRITRGGMVTKALTLLAESRGIELSQPRLELYLEDLADLPLEPLLKGIETWRREGSPFFPQVPEIRRLVNPQPDEDAEAEAAWRRYELWVKLYYHPDRGVRGKWNFTTHDYDPVPPLDERTERAMRSIGGPYAVWNTADYGEGTTDRYPFVKRDFIAAWKLAPAVELAEAKSLAAGPERPGLGSAPGKVLAGIQALVRAKSM